MEGTVQIHLIITKIKCSQMNYETHSLQAIANFYKGSWDTCRCCTMKIKYFRGKFGRYFGYFMIFVMWAVHVGVNVDYALD